MATATPIGTPRSTRHSTNNEAVSIALQSHTRLAAENLFLRKQLTLYVERKVRPRRANNATRLTLVTLTRFIDWRPMLIILQPQTLSRWHRHAFRWPTRFTMFMRRDSSPHSADDE